MQHTLSPIGRIRSCFSEKFAIPRQPMLAPDATGVVELYPPFDQPEAVQGLEQVSHVWLIFLFHQCPSEAPRLRVRPPRLGGNRKIGVFASRATHRPNGIGQSVVRLQRLEPGRLHVSGIDLVDGTPILDIKPYVPYADQVPEASNAIAPEPPAPIDVDWQPQALADAEAYAHQRGQALVPLVEQCLRQDPRPAYQQPGPERIYGTRFWDAEIQWHYPAPARIRVLSVKAHDS